MSTDKPSRTPHRYISSQVGGTGCRLLQITLANISSVIARLRVCLFSRGVGSAENTISSKKAGRCGGGGSRVVLAVSVFALGFCSAAEKRLPLGMPKGSRFFSLSLQVFARSLRSRSAGDRQLDK